MQLETAYDFDVSNPTPPQRRKRIVRVYALSFAILFSVVAVTTGFVFWHPMGWIGSAIVALVFYVAACRHIRRLLRAVSEEDAIALQDSILGMDKEPPKNWYFLP